MNGTSLLQAVCFNKTVCTYRHCFSICRITCRDSFVFVRTLDCKMNVVLQFQVFYGLLGELNSHLITPNTNWRHKLRLKFYLSYC